MKFDSGEVLSIEDLGEMDGVPIKAVHFKGGFVAGVKSDGDKSKVLATASHLGILRFAIKKSCPSFRPALMKSESTEAPVTDSSSLLPETLSKSGYGLFAIHKNSLETEYSITKHCITEFFLTGLAKSDSIELSKLSKQSPIISQVSIAIGKAAAREAVNASKEFIEFDGKKFDAKKLAG